MPGEILDFTYYIKAMTEIKDDVKIKFWVEDIETEEVLLSPLPNICGDNIKHESEECDEGDNNGKLCIPNYDKICNYCDEDCKLQSIKGSFCGDNECNEEETKFNCEEDCGKPTVLEKLSNFFGITGYAIIAEGEDVIYVGDIGDELTESAELYLFTDMYGKYEFHVQLIHNDYTVESVRPIEISYDVQPTLNAILGGLTEEEKKPLDFNLSLHFNVDETIPIEITQEITKDNVVVWGESRSLSISRSLTLENEIKGLEDGIHIYNLNADYLGQTYELTKQFTVSGVREAPTKGADFLRIIYMFFLAITSLLILYLIYTSIRKIKPRKVKIKIPRKFIAITSSIAVGIPLLYYGFTILQRIVDKEVINFLLVVLGIMFSIYLIKRSITEIILITKRPKRKRHFVRVKHIIHKPKRRRLSEKQKLFKKIRNWQSQGYDTRILEEKLKKPTLEEIKKQRFEKKLKEWESKGYDTTVLRHEMNLKPKIVRITKSDKKILNNVHKLEQKINEWKLQGYDTSVLDERLKRILDRKH